MISARNRACGSGSIGPYLGFTTLTPLYWLLLALTLLAYMLLTQGVKTWLIRRARLTAAMKFRLASAPRESCHCS